MSKIGQVTTVGEVSKNSSISISIKSEIDSRVILYPLMRCLLPLGNILVITSNKQVQRLIDMELEGYFRNFHIVVDTEGSTDDIVSQFEIDIDSYTYVIYDNVGVVEQDKLIIAIGPIISESFEEELNYLGEDKNTHILRFGKPIIKKGVKKSESKKIKKDLSDEEVDELSSNKFKIKKEDITVKLKKLPNLKFPTFENIELFESDKKFYQIDTNFIKFFYAIFQNYIGIKEPFFIKEVTKRDENSSSINQRNASGENNIIIDAE